MEEDVQITLQSVMEIAIHFVSVAVFAAAERLQCQPRCIATCEVAKGIVSLSRCRAVYDCCREVLHAPLKDEFVRTGFCATIHTIEDNENVSKRIVDVFKCDRLVESHRGESEEWEVRICSIADLTCCGGYIHQRNVFVGGYQVTTLSQINNKGGGTRIVRDPLCEVICDIRDSRAYSKRPVGVKGAVAPRAQRGDIRERYVRAVNAHLDCVLDSVRNIVEAFPRLAGDSMRAR